jgi:hypothetical protein
MGGHVGIKEGLHVTVGRAGILKLWLRLYPGDIHADLWRRNDARGKRADFGKVEAP